jgi:hypothetical protein
MNLAGRRSSVPLHQGSHGMTSRGPVIDRRHSDQASGLATCSHNYIRIHPDKRIVLIREVIVGRRSMWRNQHQIDCQKSGLSVTFAYLPRMRHGIFASHHISEYRHNI